jgi:DNA-binding transcriptional regulator YiaG
MSGGQTPVCGGFFPVILRSRILCSILFHPVLIVIQWRAIVSMHYIACSIELNRSASQEENFRMPNEPKRNALSQAMIDLRAVLEMRQQDLATALGRGTRTVAEWETSGDPPPRDAVAALWRLSQEIAPAIAKVFREFYLQDILISAEIELDLLIELAYRYRGNEDVDRHLRDAVRSLTLAGLKIREMAERGETKESVDYINARLSYTKFLWKGKQ